MMSLLTPDFVSANGLPTDETAQRGLVAGWHKRKTDIYTRMVSSGAPPRAGIARLVGEAIQADWELGVASTSAEESVRSVLEHAVGPETARRLPRLRRGRRPPQEAGTGHLPARAAGHAPGSLTALVIEDSENGVKAALAAGLKTVVTVSSFTADEDFSGASLVVSSLGDADEPARVISDPHGIHPAEQVSLADLARILTVEDRPHTTGGTMSSSELQHHRIRHPHDRRDRRDNEIYFGQLDSVVGDGDFGYSLARGFEVILADWDSFDRSDIGPFLQKIAVGDHEPDRRTSGPIWGSALLRAAAQLKGRDELTGQDAVAMRCGPRSRGSRNAAGPTSGIRP